MGLDATFSTTDTNGIKKELLYLRSCRGIHWWVTKNKTNLPLYRHNDITCSLTYSDLKKLIRYVRTGNKCKYERGFPLTQLLNIVKEHNEALFIYEATG